MKHKDYMRCDRCDQHHHPDQDCDIAPKLTFDEWVAMCPVRVVFQEEGFSSAINPSNYGPNRLFREDAPVTAIIVEREEP